MIVGLLAFMLIVWAICNDINEGLPNHIARQNFGIINGAYVLLNVLAPFIVSMSLSGEFIFILWGALLYVVASLLKRITWKIAYGFYPNNLI